MNVVNFIVIGAQGFDLFRSIRSSHQILFLFNHTPPKDRSPEQQIERSATQIDI